MKKELHIPIVNFGISLILALVYLFNTLWIISYDVELPTPKSFLSLYIILFFSFLLIINLVSSLLAQFILLATQCFNGSGTFVQTRRTVLYSFLMLIPANLLSCVLQYTFQHPTGNWVTLKIFTYSGIAFSIIIAFIALIKNTALTHKISLFYAFISVVLAQGIVGGITLLLQWLKLKS